MRKLEGRAVICILLALLLIAGLGLFIGKLVIHGDEWASFYANSHVYKDGYMAVGSVYDRNGVLLLKNDQDGQHYHEDSAVRRATVHVVGDKDQNIVTGATYAFKSDMVGYNLITGTKGVLFGSGRSMSLTIDAQVSEVAYEALGSRNGFVGVYNWKTGEILCAVSKPAADPATSSGNSETGTYINKVISSKAIPGSTFKLVTAAAAIEEIDDIDKRKFKCTGRYEIEGEYVTCQKAHGTMDFHGALANSCNCAFAQMTVEMGKGTMKSTVKKLGLTSAYDINGIKSQKGSFDFDTAKITLGWSGIGQGKDQVNPLSMMVFMGAIAGEGTAAEPNLLMDSKTKTTTLLDAETAKQLKEMMRNNVIANYGESNYPGLNLHAKSGTAEDSKDGGTNAWFCGFSGDYAFIVCVEKGGYGSQVAGPVAGRVLQAIPKETADN